MDNFQEDVQIFFGHNRNLFAHTKKQWDSAQNYGLYRLHTLLVDQKSAAGYLTGWGDQEYLGELLDVRREDVDIDAQTFWVTTRKGKSKVPRRTPKVIKDIALPFWKEYLANAPAGDFLFAKGWQPGAAPYTRWHVTELWREVVKQGLGINADLYSLKHLHYDETDAALGADFAAAAAGHTTTEMAKHYAVTKTQRELERVKKLRNAFA